MALKQMREVRSGIIILCGLILAVMAITGRNQNASGSDPACLLGSSAFGLRVAASLLSRPLPPGERHVQDVISVRLCKHAVFVFIPAPYPPRHTHPPCSPPPPPKKKKKKKKWEWGGGGGEGERKRRKSQCLLGQHGHHYSLLSLSCPVGDTRTTGKWSA